MKSEPAESRLQEVTYLACYPKATSKTVHSCDTLEGISIWEGCDTSSLRLQKTCQIEAKLPWGSWTGTRLLVLRIYSRTTLALERVREHPHRMCGLRALRGCVYNLQRKSIPSSCQTQILKTFLLFCTFHSLELCLKKEKEKNQHLHSEWGKRDRL